MNSHVVAIRKVNWKYRAGDWIYNHRLQIGVVAGPILNFGGLVALIVSEGMAPGQAKNLAVTGSVAVEVGSLILTSYTLANYHTRLDEANKKLRSYRRNEKIVADNSSLGR